jgi:hypothetical protein
MKDVSLAIWIAITNRQYIFAFRYRRLIRDLYAEV